MRTEQPSDPLQGRRLLVAASGSIAAVKTPLLVSALAKTGAEVRCVVTPSAADLVSPVALASLSRHRCYQDGDEWSPGCSRPLHIELAEWAELVLVAPLSASTLARWTHGLADGLLEIAAGWHVVWTPITSNTLTVPARVCGADPPIDARAVTWGRHHDGHRPPQRAAPADVGPHPLM